MTEDKGRRDAPIVTDGGDRIDPKLVEVLKERVGQKPLDQTWDEMVMEVEAGMRKATRLIEEAASRSTARPRKKVPGKRWVALDAAQSFVQRRCVDVL